MPFIVYPVAAPDASTAFRIELDPRAIAAQEEVETSNAQGAAREAILKKHLGEDYDRGYRGTAYGLHGVSEGLTPAKLAEMLAVLGEPFDPCADRETFDHSMMVNVESELAAQLELISNRRLNAVVEAYKRDLLQEM